MVRDGAVFIFVPIDEYASLVDWAEKYDDIESEMGNDVYPWAKERAEVIRKAKERLRQAGGLVSGARMLTDAQRAKLSEHGFITFHDADVVRDPVTGRLFAIDETLGTWVKIASILGIAPSGYRLVPTEVAYKAAGKIRLLAHTYADAGFKGAAEELEIIASVLLGKEVDKL